VPGGNAECGHSPAHDATEPASGKPRKPSRRGIRYAANQSSFATPRGHAAATASRTQASAAQPEMARPSAQPGGT